MAIDAERMPTATEVNQRFSGIAHLIGNTPMLAIEFTYEARSTSQLVGAPRFF